MASGIHLASLYVGLELMSLSSYILAGYFKNEQKSTEAAMKYFILGAELGDSVVWDLAHLRRHRDPESRRHGAVMSTQVSNDALMFGIMLLGAGLCFKIAAVPFHVWTPDVYEGAPTPITAFLSTASKAAAFAICAHLLRRHASLPPTGSNAGHDRRIAMVLGNLAAITQDSLKRMLAYSSIAHAGYVLLGIIAVSEMGLYGVLVYSVVYVFATLGIWATVLMLERHEYAGEAVNDFDGLHKRAPFWAFAMVVFLLSLGGIPPTADSSASTSSFTRRSVRASDGWRCWRCSCRPCRCSSTSAS
jgi:NADH-quinone oxidoreductase subunit N